MGWTPFFFWSTGRKNFEDRECTHNPIRRTTEQKKSIKTSFKNMDSPQGRVEKYFFPLCKPRHGYLEVSSSKSGECFRQGIVPRIGWGGGVSHQEIELISTPWDLTFRRTWSEKGPRSNAQPKRPGPLLRSRSDSTRARGGGFLYREKHAGIGPRLESGPLTGNTWHLAFSIRIKRPFALSKKQHSDKSFILTWPGGKSLESPVSYPKKAPLPSP